MTFQDFSLPIHKSMHQPDLLLGIPKTIFALLLCLTILIAYLLGLWFGLIGIIIYIPCAIISKDDPHLLTIALDNLLQPDHLEG
jgi:type IV secretory pathway VirB3-like protein